MCYAKFMFHLIVDTTHKQNNMSETNHDSFFKFKLSIYEMVFLPSYPSQKEFSSQTFLIFCIISATPSTRSGCPPKMECMIPQMVVEAGVSTVLKLPSTKYKQEIVQS